jgi:hypothetical protein
MAFVRRKGNAFYLVHNVRRGEKVQQLHLARLGEHARITDEVVREVAKKHPFVELDWPTLREQVNRQPRLAEFDSAAVEKLVSTLRNVNVNLADLQPPLLKISESARMAQEIQVQLRLLQGTIQVKLDQFDRDRRRFGSASARQRAR